MSWHRRFVAVLMISLCHGKSEAQDAPRPQQLLAQLAAPEPWDETFAYLERQADGLVPALVDAVQREETRIAALIALAHLGTKAAASTPILLETLRGGSVPEMWLAAAALGAIGPPADAAAPELVGALTHPLPLVRLFAVRALRQMGRADEDRWVLLDSLVDPHGSIRVEALYAFTKVGPQTWKNPARLLVSLVQSHTSRPPNVYRFAEPPLNESGLFDSIDSVDPHARLRVALAVSLFEPHAKGFGVSALTEQLVATEPLYRVLSARVLGYVGSSSAIPELYLALDDTDRRVRDAARTAIDKIRDTHGASAYPIDELELKSVFGDALGPSGAALLAPNGEFIFVAEGDAVPGAIVKSLGADHLLMQRRVRARLGSPNVVRLDLFAPSENSPEPSAPWVSVNLAAGAPRGVTALVHRASKLNIVVDADVTFPASFVRRNVPANQLLSQLAEANRLEAMQEGSFVRISTHPAEPGPPSSFEYVGFGISLAFEDTSLNDVLEFITEVTSTELGPIHPSTVV